MARLTAEERATLQALADRAKAEDEADASTEVWVKNDKGHEVKLTGTKARKFLSQFGLDDEDGDDDEPEGEGDEDEHDDAPGDKGGYFNKRPKNKG